MIFPITKWRNVSAATHDPQLMAALVEQYYSAIRAYVQSIIRPTEDADDITQEFIEKRLLNGALLVKADQRRGRFRIYLKAALKNFVTDKRRVASAAEKSSAIAFSAIESSRIQLAERNLDREYSRSVLEQALSFVQEHCRERGLLAQWRVFDAQVLRPALGCAAVSVETLMAELNIDSAQQVYSMKQTMLRMLKRELESVLKTKRVSARDLPSEIDYIIECAAHTEC